MVPRETNTPFRSIAMSNSEVTSVIPDCRVSGKSGIHKPCRPV